MWCFWSQGKRGSLSLHSARNYPFCSILSPVSPCFFFFFFFPISSLDCPVCTHKPCVICFLVTHSCVLFISLATVSSVTKMYVFLVALFGPKDTARCSLGRTMARPLGVPNTFPLPPHRPPIVPRLISDGCWVGRERDKAFYTIAYSCRNETTGHLCSFFLLLFFLCVSSPLSVDASRVPGALFYLNDNQFLSVSFFLFVLLHTRCCLSASSLNFKARSRQYGSYGSRCQSTADRVGRGRGPGSRCVDLGGHIAA